VSTKASAGAGDSGDRRDLISAELNPANIEIAAKTQAPHGATRPLDAIVVGDRHRKDMGDIADLSANIAELGLLHRWDMHGDEVGTPDEDDRTVEPQERPPEAVLQ
jgi:hypothetical protein